ncbi:hypothetical protein I4U23_018857 [Adineta vaga]|nr:hypothetical protein I4U23_018857 [Adineta vaga]
MDFSIINLFMFLIILSQSTVAEEWNYSDQGPDVWSDSYPACAGRSQSPIDVDTQTTEYIEFTKFRFTSAYNVTQNFTLANTGHTILGEYIDNDTSAIAFQGGGLYGTYEFVNFHLHWGENYKSGSEHQVNGNKFTAELHLVHRHTVTNQLAVLGIFIQSVKNINATHVRRRKRDTSITENSTLTNWENYLTQSGKLTKTDDTMALSLNLASLFPENTENYWRYSGSLTVPPCTEGVIWTLFKDSIVLEDSYFLYLRDHIFAKDFRGPQPIYGRKVYRSFPREDPISAAHSIFSFKTYFYILFIYLYVYVY